LPIIIQEIREVYAKVMSLSYDNISKSGFTKPLVGEVTPNPRSKDRNRAEDQARQKKEKKGRPEASEDNIARKKAGDVDRYV